MTHPRHGTTHAVGAEVDWNKKHGWVIDEGPKIVSEVKEIEEIKPMRRGPGRPRAVKAE